MMKEEVVVSVVILALVVGIASCGGQSVGGPMAGPPDVQITGDNAPSAPWDDSPRVAAAGAGGGRGQEGGGGPGNGPGSNSSCILCHANPPEDENASWDEAPGDHADCLLCHQPVHSSNPPTTTCLDCHQEDWAAGHDSADTDCLGCHQYPHLPSVDCLACHVTPPENSEASWDDVVPAHAVCGDCHTGSHGTSPDYTDEFCVTCHPEYAGSGNHGDATCKDCHDYPHLMTMGWQCWKCHNY